MSEKACSKCLSDAFCLHTCTQTCTCTLACPRYKSTRSQAGTTPVIWAVAFPNAADELSLVWCTAVQSCWKQCSLQHTGLHREHSFQPLVANSSISRWISRKTKRHVYVSSTAVMHDSCYFSYCLEFAKRRKLSPVSKLTRVLVAEALLMSYVKIYQKPLDCQWVMPFLSHGNFT